MDWALTKPERRREDQTEDSIRGKKISRGSQAQLVKTPEAKTVRKGSR